MKKESNNITQQHHRESCRYLDDKGQLLDTIRDMERVELDLRMQQGRDMGVVPGESPRGGHLVGEFFVPFSVFRH